MALTYVILKPFTSSNEGFASTDGANMTAVWSSSGGNPNGRIIFDLSYQHNGFYTDHPHPCGNAFAFGGKGCGQGRPQDCHQ